MSTVRRTSSDRLGPLTAVGIGRQACVGCDDHAIIRGACVILHRAPAIVVDCQEDALHSGCRLGRLLSISPDPSFEAGIRSNSAGACRLLSLCGPGARHCSVLPGMPCASMVCLRYAPGSVVSLSTRVQQAEGKCKIVCEAHVDLRTAPSIVVCCQEDALCMCRLLKRGAS